MNLAVHRTARSDLRVCSEKRSSRVRVHGPVTPLYLSFKIESGLRIRRYRPILGACSPQVMSAQPTTAGTPVLEGEASGPQYGAVQQPNEQAAPPHQNLGPAPGDRILVNGVDHRQTEVARDEPPRAGPRQPEQSGDGLTEPRLETREAGGQEHTMMRTVVRDDSGRGDVVSPDRSSGFLSMSPQSLGGGRAAAGSVDQPERAERTVAMEYSYEAGHPGQPGVRWVAKLTEFLRSTSTRTHGLQGRVLESLGLTTTQAAQPSALDNQHYTIHHSNTCSGLSSWL